MNTQNTDNYDNDYTDEYYADNCTDEYDAMNDMFDQCATISDIFTCMQNDEDAWFVDLNIDGRCTNVKIDTGTACSVMSAGKTDVKFVGHLLTRDGVKPSPERIKSIMEMPEPENHMVPEPGQVYLCF